MASQILWDESTRTVTGSSYVGHVDSGDPFVTLCDNNGREISRLCLLTSFDTSRSLDESYDIQPLTVDATRNEVRIVLRCASSAWNTKRTTLRCLPDRLELVTDVTGSGVLSGVTLFGGSAVLPRGSAGKFRSGIRFESLFDPNPTEPVRVVRSARSAASLGVVGDTFPGRWNGVFSPPPMCLALGRNRTTSDPTSVPEGPWTSLSVVSDVRDLRFSQMRYEPVDDGFWLTFDYDERTTVDGSFIAPKVVIRPGLDSPWSALRVYRADLIEGGYAPSHPGSEPARWWSEPILCGWGVQCARARGTTTVASDLCHQSLYDEVLEQLATHGIVPGTIVVDDRWQSEYGTCEPDTRNWSNLKAWVAGRHAAGQKVLLWFKAWDPAGLPPFECLVTPSGQPVAVDIDSPRYWRRLRDIVTLLLGPDGVDADGFKVDFTQRAPAGASLRRGDGGEVSTWGIAALHRLLTMLYGAAKDTKSDALVITHTPHPSFGDVADMIRLNDWMDTPSVVEQGEFRHRVVSAVLPDHLIDTDQWPMPDKAQWLAYTRSQPHLGVPALYYAESMDRTGELIDGADLAVVAKSWRAYRADRRSSLNAA